MLLGIQEAVSSKTLSLQEHSDSYFVRLYLDIVGFIKSLSKDVRIEYLDIKAYLDKETIDFLQKLQPASLQPVKKTVSDYLERLADIKQKLREMLRVLDRLKQYIQEYSFYSEVDSSLRRMYTDLATYTIVQIESN